MPTSKLEIAGELRKTVLAELYIAAEATLTEPALGNGVEHLVAALGETLSAYESIVEAAHSSSSRSYAFTDLPREELQRYEKVKHIIRTLGLLYPAEPVTPGR